MIFLLLALFLPETCRAVVADGSIPPPKICANVSDFLRHRSRAKRGIEFDREEMAALRQANHFKIPNPLSAFAVLKDLESNLLMITLGLGEPIHRSLPETG